MKAKVLILLALIALLLTVGCKGLRQGEQGQCPNGCQRPMVLAFTASWCAPCQRAKPVLVQVQVAGVNVQIIDIDEHPELARKYGVTDVPTYIIYVCGKEPVRTNDVSAVVSLLRL